MNDRKDMSLYLTQNEAESLKKQAAEKEMSQQEFLNELLLGSVPEEPPALDWDRMAGRLKEAGRKLDAIAHEGNRTAWIDTDACTQAVREVTELLRELETAMGGKEV